MNLRGIRESGTAFAVPTYALHVAIIGDDRLRAAPALLLGDAAAAPRAPSFTISAGARPTA